MKYIQPFDQPSNATAPYIDEGIGVDGSIPPAKFFNNVQAELVDLITFAGLTPTDADLTQIRQAVLALIPTPTGAPSDASLVHFAVDAGSTNVVSLVPVPSVIGLTQGCLIFFVPAATNTGGAVAQIALSGGGTTTREIVRPGGASLSAGDYVAGRANALLFDGVKCILLFPPARVKTDGITILGDGDAQALSLPRPQYMRAWGRWRGGTLVNSHRVLSVDALGQGLYRVTLADVMPNIDYYVQGQFTATGGDPGAWVTEVNTATRSTTKFELRVFGLNLGLPVGANGDFAFGVYA